MPKIVLAGGSGFLGRHLATDLLGRGHDVVVLSRNPQPGGRVRQVDWDGATIGPWQRELDGEDVRVVNLAGKLVDARPTSANVAALRTSRVDATRILVEAARGKDVTAWLQASTTAIWSDAGEARVTETTALPTGKAALPQMTGVAVPWERAIQDADTEKLSILRTSIVLAPDCPAVDRLVTLAKLGAGGTVGSGRQWFSWIHLTDWLAIARAALGVGEFDLPSGVVAATGPNPVRNATLMRELRKLWAPSVLGYRLGVPTPSPLLRLGARLIGTDPALAWTGRHVTSEVLAGRYEFEFPTLEGALWEIRSA
ncbi:MAG: NAD-dependent epimerase/dehydratase family protein [Propionibacteriaceae bacterium]|nr:NAD-dependent epimerase/dehydratase family protein [Propionibacteriaceae bacterium]